MTGRPLAGDPLVFLVPGCAGLATVLTTVLAGVLVHRLVDRMRRRRRLDRIGLPPYGGTPWWQRHRRTLIFMSGCAAALAALAMAGPVGSLVAGAYAALAARAAVRRRMRRARTVANSRALDALSALAADLRAGAAPAAALATALPAWTPHASWPVRPQPPACARTPGDATGNRDASGAGCAAEGIESVAVRVAAAWRVAETAGAPLADLLDRLDADLRSAARVRLSATAQAAGVRATAMLLAVLPAGGLALGYGIGVDPVRVLLHTPAGAACAIGALVLQLLGLAWSNRLARSVERVS